MEEVHRNRKRKYEVNPNRAKEMKMRNKKENKQK